MRRIPASDRARSSSLRDSIQLHVSGSTEVWSPSRAKLHILGQTRSTAFTALTGCFGRSVNRIFDSKIVLKRHHLSLPGIG